MNYLLKSVTIIDNQSKFHHQKKDILIKNGIISKIASSIKNLKNTKEITLDNLHISNGWFDTSVSFGEPGYEDRETISNGLDTAAKSGFTMVAVNSNCKPFIDNSAMVSFLKNKAQNNAVTLHPIANLTKNSEGKDLAELYDMQQSGAIAFGDYNKAIQNANLLKIALLYAQNFDGIILSYPQNEAIADNGLVNEAKNNTLLGLKSIPPLAEELQIARDLYILEYTGGKLHIPTISTSKAVALIKAAKKKGLKVTCSTTAHHLTLTDEHVKTFNTNTKVLPPLRTKKDTKALLKGVLDGTIDCITSDHNPINIEHKKVTYNNAKFGTIGLESLFVSLCRKLPLETLVDCLTSKPKNCFGISQQAIKTGITANLTLFTPKGSGIFTENDIKSTSKNSIYLDQQTQGKVYGIFTQKKLQLND